MVRLAAATATVAVDQLTILVRMLLHHLSKMHAACKSCFLSYYVTYHYSVDLLMVVVLAVAVAERACRCHVLVLMSSPSCGRVGVIVGTNLEGTWRYELCRRCYFDLTVVVIITSVQSSSCRRI